MTSIDENWRRYLRWNDAVAAVVFPTVGAGRPAYLDLEDDVLNAMRAAAEPSAVEPATALVEAVKGVLRLDGGASSLFGQIHLHMARWEFGPKLEAPPTLALLALLSLAAEKMHEGEGQASHNFYGRLAQLLGLHDRQKKWFIDAYRRFDGESPASERLWASLNDWLERLEGNRGLATAYSDSHAHVGLPLSQALVRQADRDRFSDLFASYGLAPHSSLPTTEMMELLGEWLSRVPCPASHTLDRAWRRELSARERIAEVARLTLEGWDGTDEAGGIASPGGHRQIDTVRVKALLRTFPIRQLEIGLALAAPLSATAESLTVVGDDNQGNDTVDLIPATSGWLALADPSQIDAGSFLRGETRLRRAGQQVLLRRRARRLVPLRRDDLLQAFVECERLGLAEDALLLARSELADNVSRVLSQAARPGYSRHDSITGLPDGWVLFDNVQILSAVPVELLRNQLVDLNVLQPLASSQTLLSGGFRLPGHIRKWSSAQAPELRVTVDGIARLSAEVVCTRPLTSPVPASRSRACDTPVMLWDLSTESLPDGDYEIRLTADGEPLGRPELLRLRSADSPAVAIDDGVLVHNFRSPLFGLCAAKATGEREFQGVPSEAISLSLESEFEAPSRVPPWYAARKVRTSRPRTPHVVQFPAPAEGSCMLTGHHHMMIETTGSSPTVEGVCKFCGLVKRYPTHGRQKGGPKAGGVTKVAPRIAVSSLQPVTKPTTINWSLGFDALCHLGGGTAASFNQIALQMEPTGLFGDSFARRLEALGHIELERNPHTLEISGWRVVDPILAGLPDGKLVLLGFRSERMLVALEDATWRMKAELTVDAGEDAPPRVRVDSIDFVGASALAESLEGATTRPVRVVARAAERLLDVHHR